MSAVETMVTRESLARDILLKLMEQEQACMVNRLPNIPYLEQDWTLWWENEDIARAAVERADALLAELAKGKEGP